MTKAEAKRRLAELDARVRALRLVVQDDAALFAAMADHLPALRDLVDAGGFGKLRTDQMLARYPDLSHYTRLLAGVAEFMQEERSSTTF